MNAFNEEFRVWMLDHDIHTAVLEYQSEADVHTFRLRPDVLPARFGVVAGNIVHQIRSTLDNLVWQLVIANGEKPRSGFGGNAFPILETEDPERTFADRTTNTLRGMHPDHRALIERLQPYQHPEWGDPKAHPLGRLGSLNNADKHQVLQVIYTNEPLDPLDVRFIAGEGRTITDSWYVPLEGRYPGAIVGWAHAEPGGFDADMKMEYAGTGQMIFEDGEPVIPGLRRLARVVDMIVTGFSRILDGLAAETITLSPAGVARLMESYNKWP